ncbi:MAG: hypothetical protein HYZ38_28735 [Mycobacterium sp.]|nr:hypothetical protein [Mycobacterium sp.]
MHQRMFFSSSTRAMATVVALLAALVVTVCGAATCAAATPQMSPQWRFTPAPAPQPQDRPALGLVGASIPTTAVTVGSWITEVP